VWVAGFFDGRLVCPFRLAIVAPRRNIPPDRVTFKGTCFMLRTKKWQIAKRMAENVKVLKNPAAKRRQIALWCQMVKQAMKVGK
jgi:hypothetical protein